VLQMQKKKKYVGDLEEEKRHKITRNGKLGGRGPRSRNKLEKDVKIPVEWAKDGTKKESSEKKKGKMGTSDTAKNTATGTKRYRGGDRFIGKKERQKKKKQGFNSTAFSARGTLLGK